MQVAILGFGSQGVSSFEYWTKLGHEVTICDRNPNTVIPGGVATQIGDNYLDGLGKYDLIIRSPSIHPRDIEAANDPGVIEKVWSNTNEFFKVCPTKNIIGVTGTKGKGTTSTLIAEMLKAAGKTVHLGGNIGTPPLEMLKENIQPDDWVVLELANFQLIDLKRSPHIAVCLAVVPEHLDWHKSLDEYISTKRQLFRWQKKDDYAIYYPASELSKAVVLPSSAISIPYLETPGAIVKDHGIWIDDQQLCKISDISLPGKHNWQNICAAATAVWQITQDAIAIQRAIIDTRSLPFRIELRRKVNEISFYNDSFATAPSATIAAIEAIDAPKVLILGGYDRGNDLSELISAVEQHQGDIRKLILIGKSGPRLALELTKTGFQNFEEVKCQKIDDITDAAYLSAKSGDAIILSPGFASFDMFKNFEDRGRQFNTAIDNL